MEEFPTTLIVNGWPASFRVSAPLTGVAAKVPEAVKVTVAPLFGLTAADWCGVMRHNTAAVVVNDSLGKFHENLALAFFWSIPEV